MISPHVYDIRERIQINGQLISEKRFTEVCAEVISNVPKDFIPTYFEILTMMGFVSTSRTSARYLVLETGLGGRLDATNVARSKNKVCVITQIGFDHTEALGETLQKIATEKVGIIHPGNTVVALRQSDEVNLVIQERCKQQNAKLVWVEPQPDYQDSNDEVAIAAVKVLAESDSWTFQQDLVAHAFKHIFIPGRFEKRALNNNLLILDGAHNSQKLSALVDHIRKISEEEFTVILAIAKRADLHKCVELLEPITARVIATSIGTSQKHVLRDISTAKEILSLCESRNIECSVAELPSEALILASTFSEPVLATGSFYLLHEIDRALQQQN